MAGVILSVKVKPNARTSSLDQLPDGSWVAKLKSRPIDGRANEELRRLVAKRFRCHQAAVLIRAGGTGRTKLLSVEEA